MIVLTPAERRGALWIVVLLLIGAAHDLWLGRSTGDSPGTPPAPSPALIEARADSTPASAPEPVAAAPSAGHPLDLNRATRPELESLPGIGPVLAGRILEQRTRAGRFRAAEELLAVRGIGPRLFARLRERVTAGSRTDSAGR